MQSLGYVTTATKKNGKPKSKYSSHDFRRTRITLNEEAGIPRQDTMRQTGHRTMSTYFYYDIRDSASQKKAIERQQEYEQQRKAEREAAAERRRQKVAELKKKLAESVWTAELDKPWTAETGKPNIDEILNELDELVEIDLD